MINAIREEQTSLIAQWAKNSGIGVQALALPFISCVTIGNLCTFPESHFSYLWNENDKIVHGVFTNIKLENACKVLSTY